MSPQSLDKSTLRTLGILGVTTFISMAGVGIIVPFLPLYARELGAGGLLMGLIFSSFSLSRALCVPYVGALSDHRGRKAFIALGLAGYAVCSLLLYTVDSPLELVLNRAAQGVFGAMILPISLALVADLTPEGWEGRLMSMFNMAFLLGFGLGPPLGGFIYDTLGLSANFAFMAGLSLLSLLAVMIFIKEPDRIKPAKRPRMVFFQPNLMRDPSFRAILLCRMGAASGMGSFMAFLPLVCAEKGISNTQVGIFFAVNVVTMVVIQTPAGRLADRLPRVPLAAWGQILSALGKVLIPFAPGYGWLLGLSVVEGLGAGLAMPALTALAVSRGRELGEGMGVVMGVFTLAMSAGVFLGPVAAGLLVDWKDSGWALWLAGGSAALGALALMLWARESQGVPAGSVPVQTRNS